MVLSPLAVTMGDPAGIGGELTLAAWLARRATGPAFFAVDCPRRLEALAASLGFAVPIATATPETAADIFPEALPVLPMPLAGDVSPGRPDPAHAEAAIESIRQAVLLAKDGRAAGLVTNPVYKRSLYDAGFRFPGQTEFVADLTAPEARPIMLLAGPELRVAPLTTHLPLADAVAAVETNAIVRLGEALARALAQDFGFSPPRIAVAGLNPHAGEEGKLGREEIDVIQPAIEALRAAGIAASGPWSPDSMFHASARAEYDAALCMYHDQALIPLKTVDFQSGVNATLGLPVVRTSPDHGTAFDIAGRGEADVTSFLAALDMAAAIAATRAGNAARAHAQAEA